MAPARTRGSIGFVTDDLGGLALLGGGARESLERVNALHSSFPATRGMPRRVGSTALSSRTRARSTTAVDRGFWVTSRASEGERRFEEAVMDGADRIESGERLVWTVPEAGRMLGISCAHAYELVARGELPHLRLGRRVVVPKQAIEVLLARVASSS